jgi:AcrR family transcriptional regulator
MARDTEQSRRDRILDAAEHVFAESGFAGASLRDIVREARVNLATVYYYFDSKEGLMEAVLKRRFGPLREAQLQLLAQFEQAARGRALPPEKILQAMLLPLSRLASSPPESRQAVTRLMGRIVTEPHEQTQLCLRGHRAEVRAAFLKAMQASVPAVPASELQWRMEFVWGALAFAMCNPRRFEQKNKGACQPADTSKVVTEMIRFFAPGFRVSAIQDLDPEVGMHTKLLKSEIRTRIPKPTQNSKKP